MLILIESWRKTNQWHKKNENVNFVPKDVQRIVSSHKSLEKYNEQEVFYKKKLPLKNSQYSQEKAGASPVPSRLQLY